MFPFIKVSSLSWCLPMTRRAESRSGPNGVPSREKRPRAGGSCAGSLPRSAVTGAGFSWRMAVGPRKPLMPRAGPFFRASSLASRAALILLFATNAFACAAPGSRSTPKALPAAAPRERPRAGSPVVLLAVTALLTSHLIAPGSGAAFSSDGWRSPRRVRRG